MLSNALLLSTLGALAAAKTIEVEVGASGLKFSPESVTAEKGDKIHFKINEGHNVAQAKFDAPCKPSGGDAIFSGEQRDFTVDVPSTDPLWMYCAVASHCSSGMVFAVNPTSDKTVQMFADAAKNADSSEAPSKEQGGDTGSSDSSSMSSGMSSMSMSMSSAMATGSMSMSMSGSGSAMASPTASGTGSSGGSSSSPSPSASSGAANSLAQGSVGMEYLLVALSGVLGAIGLL